MMKKILVLTILSISNNFFSQQKFSHLGFQVSAPCTLYENNTFKSMAKGMVDVVEALVCASQKPVAIYNLNVYRDSSESASSFNAKYQKDLSKSGIEFKKMIISGLPATEYTFTQNGIPAKAVVFYKSGKSYLLQVTAPSNIEALFSNFNKSLKIK